MAQTAQININVNAKQATDTVGQLNQELNQTSKSFNSMKAELRAITQDLLSSWFFLSRVAHKTANSGNDQLQ